MKLLRRTDTRREIHAAFVGFTDEIARVIELTHNWGVEKYDLGNAFGISRSKWRMLTRLARRSTARRQRGARGDR